MIAMGTFIRDITRGFTRKFDLHKKISFKDPLNVVDG